MAIASSFDLNLFVLPRAAHQWLVSRVKRWEEINGEESPRELWPGRSRRVTAAPGDQVLSLSGEHGAGKTWLLTYLAYHERQTAGQVAYVDLAERFRFPNPEQYLRAVKARLEQPDGVRRVLLIDSVPPHLDEVLRAVEDGVLRPHLVQRSSLVIMALEHPSQTCWRAPALRGGDHYQLPAFDEGSVERQVQRLQQGGLARPDCEARALERDAAGLPLLIHLLATRPRLEAFGLLLEHWFSRIPPEDGERVRHYLVAVCLLSALEHGAIQRMLDVYYHYLPDASGYPAHPSGVRNILQKYWLARPMPGAPGRIVLVASVRHAAQELLKIQDPALYTLLDEMASVLRGG